MNYYQFLAFPDQSVAIRRTESDQWEVFKGRGGDHLRRRQHSSAGDFIGAQNRSLGPAIDIIRRACERDVAQAASAA